MVIRRPTGPALLTVLLIVLLPALAVLQYRWVGQLSDGERERMQRSVRNAADQFRDTFDDEITRAALALNVGAATASDGESDQYSDRYNSWVTTAVFPQIVASIYLIDEDRGELRLRRWNPTVHVFEPSLWPASIDHWRPHFIYALEEYNAGRLPALASRLVGEESLIAIPIRQGGGGRPGSRPPVPQRPVFGFTVLDLDMPYLRNQLIPQLAERYFVNPQGDGYRVQVNAADDPSRVLYRSDPALSIDVASADASEPLGDTTFFTRGLGRTRGDNVASRWRLLVQHQSGSLETAVGVIRRRNLAISFGVLLMLTVSVAMLAATSRKAERLAQQQMEFVAGVSHELRTPVAVIRSAAENLASGVVSGERVKRYGQMLEGEARRLGEMVERVLQYAGIESGLGLGTRAPLAPAEIIDAAIETMPLLGADDLQIHREVPPDLPSVLGDAPALRSAIQNLVANAAKYGGRDRWVGIRAQHVRERRRSEVWITVSDHGPGIPAAELPHIFEPFYRGAEALEKQIHGNGLGLSLVRRIVNAHGGRVTVATKPGAGSAFTITLPVALADARTSAVAEGAMQVGAHT